MTNDDLSARLQRVYAALDATLETDINKASPIVRSDARSTAIYQDFRGDLSDPEMENLAYSLIHNLDNLRDHSRRWMAKNRHDAKQVDAFTSANPPVAILQDLSNNDKHGYPPRNGGVSRKSPKLVNVRRIMRLSTGTQPGSSIGFFITPSGEQKVVGSGAATLIVTGEVHDASGAVIGDLHALQSDALSAWEGLLQSLGPLK